MVMRNSPALLVLTVGSRGLSFVIGFAGLVFEVCFEALIYTVGRSTRLNCELSRGLDEDVRKFHRMETTAMLQFEYRC